MPTRRLPLLALAALLAGSAPALATVPAPYDPARFSFPGSVPSPGDGVAAALAGADQWLSAAGGANPAVVPVRSGVRVSPMLQRIDRQDLGADNSEFSQTTAFIDAAGASIAWRPGVWGVVLHASQPVLRRETSTFSVGIFDGLSAPARVQVDASHRESRFGLALSRGFGGWRVGLSGEWIRRDDQMTTLEVSGSPESGERLLRFDGSAVGGALGVAWTQPEAGRRPLSVGFALRSVGALTVEGEAVAELLAEDTREAVRAERGAVTEGGGSVRLGLGPDTGLWAMAGWRSAEDWREFALVTDAATRWRLGLDYHGADTPWTVRLGFGIDDQPGTPEPRASVLGLGFGWDAGDLGLDLGLTHRSFRRGDLATQHDDRLVATLRVGF